MVPDIGWVDACLFAVFALSLAVGLMRGFVFEVLSLAGWVAAWLIAQAAAPALAPYLPVGAPGSLLNRALAFALAFFAALLVWGLVARLIRGLVRATPLSGVDRLLGAVFGALRGALVLLAIAAIVGLTPAARSPAWRASVVAGGLEEALQRISPWLRPPDGAPAAPLRHTESNRGSNPCAASSA